MINSPYFLIANGEGHSIQAFVVSDIGSLNELQTMGAVSMAAMGLQKNLID